MEMNLYDILCISKNASPEDIKKAYRSLSIKYHPDKSTEVGAEERFIKIKCAYETLINENSRKEYDESHSINKVKLFDIIHDFLSRRAPYIQYCFDTIMSLYDNDDKFKDDINNLRIDNIYQTILSKLDPSIQLRLDIRATLECNIIDRYLDRYMKIEVNRETKPPKEFIVPIKNDVTIYRGEGETDGINSGDLIISIAIVNETRFKYLDSDLYYNLKIPLYDYLYGGVINFIQLDGTETNIPHSGFLRSDSTIILQNKGLPKQDHNLIIVDHRGDLMIDIDIDGLDEIKNKVADIYLKI